MVFMFFSIASTRDSIVGLGPAEAVTYTVAVPVAMQIPLPDADTENVRRRAGHRFDHPTSLLSVDGCPNRLPVARTSQKIANMPDSSKDVPVARIINSLWRGPNNLARPPHVIRAKTIPPASQRKLFASESHGPKSMRRGAFVRMALKLKKRPLPEAVNSP